MLLTENATSFRLILKRSLNKNQILILSEIQNNGGRTITATLNDISRKSGVSLSTLKLNSRILKNLGLISYAEYRTAELTGFGEMVVDILR